MSVQPVLLAGRALERLFTPSIRLGWTFRDRHGLTAPYPEPQPDPEVLREQISERAAAAQASYIRARRWVIKPSLALGLLLLLLAGYAEGRNNATDAAPTLAAAVIVTGAGLGYTVRCWWRRGRTAAARPEQNHRKALEAWQRRAADHQQAGPAWDRCPSGPARRRRRCGQMSSAAASEAGRTC